MTHDGNGVVAEGVAEFLLITRHEESILLREIHEFRDGRCCVDNVSGGNALAAQDIQPSGLTQ